MTPRTPDNMLASPKRVRVPEKVLQRQIQNLLRSVGAQVWISGTRRPRADAHQGTCMTPGWPDICAFIRGELVFIEVKAEGGTVSMPQMLFAACCHDAKVRHVFGGVTEVLAYLVERGIIREVAHYRQGCEEDACLTKS